jgi:isoleucyl-tRNA synthetase
VQDTRKSAGFDVSDRIVLDLVFFADADADALRSVSVVDIAGETLATSFTVSGPRDTEGLDGYRGELVTEWIGNATATAPEHVVRVDAGKYSNEDDFVVAVSRQSGIRNV